MGFWDSILRRGNEPTIGVFTPNVNYVGADGLAAALDLNGASPVSLWDTQPHLRTVVSFVARNIAQLGLHVFDRVGDTDRRRDTKSPLPRALFGVDGTMTTYELIFALVGDLLLYDRAYWWVAPSSDLPSGWMIRRLPPAWVTPTPGDAFTVKSYQVSMNGSVATVPADRILAFTNYAPGKPGAGSSTVEALKQTLQEQIEAATYRAQVWKRGGRVSSVLQRPKDAPEWSPEAREQFRDDWYAKYTGRGSRAGGTPILEDGMTLQRIDFNAQEQQFVEAAKLSLTTVAAAYHVNPTMVGQMDNANYSNVREFRKMLYGDSLGPMIVQIEQRINSFLLPMLGADNATQYAEFNVESKLRGDFLDRAAVMATSIGGPWMTRNEGRSLDNRPPIEGGDSLIVPLNVVVGGQASPRDSGSQNRNSGQPSIKARPANHDDQHKAVVSAFFKRQRKAVLSRLGAKANATWWDQDRWDGELDDTLSGLYMLTSKAVALSTLAAAGIDEDGYDVDRTTAFLRESAKRSAKSINATTKAQLDASLAEDDDEDVQRSTPAGVFDVAENSRSGEIAATSVTFAAAFGATEAARQNSGRATKTWVVTSGNPRPSHASMSGETVPVSSDFSNGMAWPGDASGGADEVAGCTCELQVDIQ